MSLRRTAASDDEEDYHSGEEEDVSDSEFSDSDDEEAAEQRSRASGEEPENGTQQENEGKAASAASAEGGEESGGEEEPHAEEAQEEEPSQPERKKLQPYEVPKEGPYYMHDDRMTEEEFEQLQREELEEKKKLFDPAEAKEGKWKHDGFESLERGEDVQPSAVWSSGRGRGRRGGGGRGRGWSSRPPREYTDGPSEYMQAQPSEELRHHDDADEPPPGFERAGGRGTRGRGRRGGATKILTVPRINPAGAEFANDSNGGQEGRIEGRGRGRGRGTRGRGRGNDGDAPHEIEQQAVDAESFAVSQPTRGRGRGRGRERGRGRGRGAAAGAESSGYQAASVDAKDSAWATQATASSQVAVHGFDAAPLQQAPSASQPLPQHPQMIAVSMAPQHPMQAPVQGMPMPGAPVMFLPPGAAMPPMQMMGPMPFPQHLAPGQFVPVAGHPMPGQPIAGHPMPQFMGMAGPVPPPNMQPQMQPDAVNSGAVQAAAEGLEATPSKGGPRRYSAMARNVAAS